MINWSKQSIEKQVGLIIMLIMAALGSLFLAFLNQEYLILIGVLLIGVPFALLVFSPQIRPTAVVLLIVFVPLTSILKAITGSRFAPLTFDLALLLAFGLYIGQGLIRHKLRLGWLDIFFLIFMFWAGLQMFNPNVPSIQAGVEGFRKFAFAAILFYIGRHFISTQSVLLWQRVLVVVSVFIVLYGLKQFFFMSAIDYRMIEMAEASPVTFLMGGWIRPFSTLPGPFHLGLYIIVVSLLLLTQLLLKYNKLVIHLTIPFLLLLHIITLFFTRTKGNWVGLVAGIVVLVILQAKRPFTLFTRLMGITLISMIAFTTLATIVPPNTISALDDAILAITNPWEAPTFLYRVQLWEEIMIPALQENPLWGYGTSSAGEGLGNLYAGTNSQHFPSHNLYLKVFLELGIVGLILFFILIIGSLGRALTGWRLARRHLVPPIIQLTQFWGIATVTAFLVAGLVIPTLDAQPINYYFWLLLGLISSHEFTRKPFQNHTEKLSATNTANTKLL